MSNITQITWTENPSRVRMPVADACAHGSALPTVIEGGYAPVAKRSVSGIAQGAFAGNLAWSPPD